MRFGKPSPAMVVAVIAVVVATAGTAFAATGQLVNIADGTTVANVAKVDAAGALKTTATVAGTVNARPVQPATPFDTSSFVSNFYPNSTRVTLFQTGAQLALTRLNYSTDIRNPSRWEVYVRYAPIPSGGTCDAFNTGSRQIARVSLTPGQSYSDTFPSAILLKPAASGQQWCLVASAASQTTSPPDGGLIGIDTSGFVVSGSFTPPASLQARSRSATPSGH